MGLNEVNENYYKIYPSNSKSDYFQMQHISRDEIEDFMLISSQLYSIQLISQEFKQSITQHHIIDSAIYALTKIYQWTCNSKENILDQIYNPPLPARQQMLRDIGLIDYVMKIIFEAYSQQLINHNLEKKNDKLLYFLVLLVRILQLISRNNKINSTYIFQWYPLLKLLATEHTIPRKIQVDQLINQIFILTDLNVNVEDDIPKIAQTLELEKTNGQALNLLLGFCRYNQFRPQETQEKLMDIIFLEYKNNIFRNLEYDTNKDILVIQKQENEAVYELDYQIEHSNKEIFQ